MEEVGKDGLSFNVHLANGTVFAILAPGQMTLNGFCTSASAHVYHPCVAAGRNSWPNVFSDGDGTMRVPPAP
jgi:hypothetical protein